jgi:hypothetical protein
VKCGIGLVDTHRVYQLVQGQWPFRKDKPFQHLGGQVALPLGLMLDLFKRFGVDGIQVCGKLRNAQLQVLKRSFGGQGLDM